MSEGVGIQPSGGTSGSPGANGAHPEVRVMLPALPANVALVRQALAGLTDELGIDATRASDMKIALTEACTNVVVHAYEDEAGPLEVTMAVEHGRLVLGVRDRGSGLRPLPARDEGGAPLGFGLALIASLSDELGIVAGRRGTEVRIAFALDDAVAPPLEPDAIPAERRAVHQLDHCVVQHVLGRSAPHDLAQSPLGTYGIADEQEHDPQVSQYSDP